MINKLIRKAIPIEAPPEVERYALACKRFDKAEADLVRALDGLAAAIASGDAASVTPANRRAKEAERLCAGAWDSAEAARSAYWLSRAEAATRKLNALVPPLLAEVITYSKFGMRTVIPFGVLQHLAAGPFAAPAIDAAITIPTEPQESAVLDRAEDEVI